MTLIAKPEGTSASSVLRTDLTSGQEASNLFLVLLYPERLSGGRMETLRASLEDLSLGKKHNKELNFIVSLSTLLYE